MVLTYNSFSLLSPPAPGIVEFFRTLKHTFFSILKRFSLIFFDDFWTNDEESLYTEKK